MTGRDTRQKRRQPSRSTRRGSVVLFVLGIILLAAFLITRLMDRALVELATESKAVHRAGLREEAFSALEASLAVLADEAAARSGLHDASEGWDRPLALMGYEPAAGYISEALVLDESGKLSLPTADEETLDAYLEAIGCPVTAQDRLVDALLAWTRPEYLSQEGKSGDTFAGTAIPYRAPERALRSFNELRAIPAAREVFFDEYGDWNELGLRFRSGASLFAFSTGNVNSARPEMLLARGVAPARVASIMAGREDRNSRGAVYHSTAELAGVWGQDASLPGLGTEATCFHVVVTVKFGGRSYQLDAWVRSGGGAPPAAGRRPPREGETTTPIASVRNNPRKRLDYPFQILELRESDGT